MLDYLPNADHAGIYAAQAGGHFRAAGLDVRLRTPTDPELLKLLRTLDASRWQAFRFAELPAAAPAALSGTKIAVAVSVIGAVFAEYAGSSAGLGNLLLQAIPQLETARAYAAVVVLAALAVSLFYLFAAAERFLAPQRPRRPAP